MHEAVCGSVFGREYGCAEGVGETEGIEGYSKRGGTGGVGLRRVMREDVYDNET